MFWGNTKNVESFIGNKKCIGVELLEGDLRKNIMNSEGVQIC